MKGLMGDEAVFASSLTPCPGAPDSVLAQIRAENLDSWEIGCQLVDIEDPNTKTSAPKRHMATQTVVASPQGYHCGTAISRTLEEAKPWWWALAALYAYCKAETAVPGLCLLRWAFLHQHRERRRQDSWSSSPIEVETGPEVQQLAWPDT